MAGHFRDKVIENSAALVFVTLSLSQETLSLDKANWPIMKRPGSEEQKHPAQSHIVLQPHSSIQMTVALFMA